VSGGGEWRGVREDTVAALEARGAQSAIDQALERGPRASRQAQQRRRGCHGSDVHLARARSKKGFENRIRD
jgi:hypothetical protein